MSDTQTINQWEKKKGLMLRGDVDPEQQVTLEEFMELMETNNYVGVDIFFRRGWLKANGYELTRENYMDNKLPTKTQDERQPQ